MSIFRPNKDADTHEVVSGRNIPASALGRLETNRRRSFRIPNPECIAMITLGIPSNFAVGDFLAFPTVLGDLGRLRAWKANTTSTAKVIE